MASITRRGKRWRAQVRVRGRSESSTFVTKAEAQRWAFEREQSIQKGYARSGQTVRDAFERYAENVSPGKKGARWEKIRLKAVSRDPLADLVLADLRHGDLADFRDRRLKKVTAGSVNRDLNLISAVLTRCVREWHWLEENPCRKLDRPRSPPPRDRRISDDEIALVLEALGEGERNQEVAMMFQLAIETGMRLGEMASLRWENVHEKHVVLVDTKNGDRRNVPLSSAARALLAPHGGSGPLFQVTAASASTLFRKAVKRTGIQNLRFHDTRHEALTRLARKLDVLDLARMIGHRNTASLMVYYNARPDEIADRLG